MAYRGSVTNIEVISRNGGSPAPFPSPVGFNTTPAWSPDGKRVAFASTRDKHSTSDGPEIYIANSNGTNMSRLLPRSTATGIDTSPVWNPATGRELVFVSDRSGSQQLYRINDDGTNLRRIIDEGGDAENPSWAPTGSFLAFAWKKSGNSRFDIYLHDLVTGKNTQLTQNTSDNEKPTWSPDGKHIAFESNRTGTLQIYSMLANGSKLQQLTHNGSNKAPAWSGYIK
jgi:TolB protein